MEYTYFSRVSSDNVVLYTTQIENSFILDESGEVSIDLGVQHLYQTFPDCNEDRWIVSDLNSPRGFGNPGYLYLPEYDRFVEPKPYPSWSLNTDNPDYFYWVSPVPLPDDSNVDGKKYVWVEELQNWVATN
jgi:hypothetical protein